VDNYAKVLARLGNLEALELFYEYLRSKRIDTPGDDWASKFATQHYAQLGAVKTLEALPSLVGKARKIGIHIPSDVFDIVAGFVTYVSKLISWHDHALRALDPVKYIRFAQGYMPQNYGCEGIEPLYAACKKTHDGMKPKGYKAPQLPLAA